MSSIDDEKRLRQKRIQEIYSSAFFMYYTRKISLEEYQDVKQLLEYDNTFKQQRNEYIDNFLVHQLELSEMYDKSIEIASKFDKKHTTINKKDLFLNESIEFLKYINCYKLYEKLKHEKMIDFNNKLADQSYCLSAGGLSYIILKKDSESYGTGKTLAHEIGHAMQNYVLRDIKIPSTSFLDIEIFSVLFERILFDFLLEFINVDRETVHNIIRNTIYTLNRSTERTKKILDAFSNPEAKIELDSLNVSWKIGNESFSEPLTKNNYAFANIASSKLFFDYLDDRDYFIKHLVDIIMEIGMMSFDSLLANYSDVSYYEKYLEKTLVRK